MINFPNSTIVNRFLPKDKFYSKTVVNTKLRELFTDEIEKITWTNKLSSTTLNIAPGDYVELQVFEIILKKSDISAQVLKHIDTYIPYPILFVIKKPNLTKLVISYKEPANAHGGLMKIAKYFETPWQEKINIELKGRSVDEIYKNFLSQISPQLDLTPEINVKVAIEDTQSREKTIKQIDALNRAILHEPSVAKQQQLARERYILENQLR